MKIQKFLSHSPIFAFYLANSDVVENFQKILNRHEVHFLQGLVLTALFFEEREVRPFELKAAFQVQRSTLSHALTSLEKKGWIKRARLSTDARAYLLSLTVGGRRKALTLVKEFDRAQTAMEAKIGARGLRTCVDQIHEVRRSYLSFSPSQIETKD